MAKRGILEHPKTLKLGRKLGIPPCFAVGILECLWHWCGRYAIQGEIKAGWEEIADAIRYPGDPEQLRDALVSSGFLDVLEDGRTVVHDVQDHADNTWKTNLKAAGLTWWNGDLPTAGKQPSSHSQATCKPLSSDLRQPEPEPEPEPIPKPRQDKTEPEPVEKGGSGGKEKRSRFSPPTEDEVRIHLVDEKGMDIHQARSTATNFWSYYDSRGWKVGRDPMVNWRSALAGWVNRDRERGTSTAIRQPQRQMTPMEVSREALRLIEEEDRLAGIA